MKNPPNLNKIGNLTLAAGIAAVLAMLVVITGFSSGNWLLGGLGDLMDILNSALVVPLLIFLGALAMAQNQMLGRAAQIIGVTGALTRLLGAFLILSGIMAIEEALPLVNAGMGLMGTSLLLTLPASRRSLGMGSPYFLFSLAVALGMATALLGVFLNDAYMPLLQGEIGLSELPPLLVALLIFAPLQILGYPIWLIWTGRRLMKLPGVQVAQPIKKSGIFS